MSGPADAGSPLVPDEVDGTLVLIRHGQSTFVAEGRFQGRLDPPLSPLGERQAALTGAWLARPGGAPGIGLSTLPLWIFHSPLSRAARSAELIAGELGDAAGVAPASLLQAMDALVEIGQGRWEGRTMTEVRERWGGLLAAWRQTPTTAWAPGGESLSDADRRVRAGLRRILAILAPGEAAAGAVPAASRPWAIVVAHDGILRLLLLALLDVPAERFWSFPFALCGVSVVDVQGGRARLRAHNLASHLAEGGPEDAPGPGGEAGPRDDGAF